MSIVPTNTTATTYPLRQQHLVSMPITRIFQEQNDFNRNDPSQRKKTVEHLLNKNRKDGYHSVLTPVGRFWNEAKPLELKPGGFGFMNSETSVGARTATSHTRQSVWFRYPIGMQQAVQNAMANGQVKVDPAGQAMYFYA